MEYPSDTITVLLGKTHEGNREALDQLMELVYEELRGIARKIGASPVDTMSPTVLVNEVYMKMVGKKLPYINRFHFFSALAKAMRRLLIDHHRSKETKKNGGDLQKVPLAPSDALFSPGPDVLALHEALEMLAKIRPRMSQIVELKYFGGLTIHEIASGLGISPRTVINEWSTARGWLLKTLYQR